uniref:Flocculation protein FLO11-like n=1 Tax=Schistocephalus solidus TaxID=70667 RepID=A0A183T255_SCHSO
LPAALNDVLASLTPVPIKYHTSDGVAPIRGTFQFIICLSTTDAVAGTRLARQLVCARGMGLRSSGSPLDEPPTISLSSHFRVHDLIASSDWLLPATTNYLREACRIMGFNFYRSSCLIFRYEDFVSRFVCLRLSVDDRRADLNFHPIYSLCRKPRRKETRPSKSFSPPHAPVTSAPPPPKCPEPITLQAAVTPVQANPPLSPVAPSTANQAYPSVSATAFVMAPSQHRTASPEVVVAGTAGEAEAELDEKTVQDLETLLSNEREESKCLPGAGDFSMLEPPALEPVTSSFGSFRPADNTGLSPSAHSTEPVPDRKPEPPSPISSLHHAGEAAAANASGEVKAVESGCPGLSEMPKFFPESAQKSPGGTELKCLFDDCFFDLEPPRSVVKWRSAILKSRSVEFDLHRLYASFNAHLVEPFQYINRHFFSPGNLPPSSEISPKSSKDQTVSAPSSTSQAIPPAAPRSPGKISAIPLPRNPTRAMSVPFGDFQTRSPSATALPQPCSEESPNQTNDHSTKTPAQSPSPEVLTTEEKRRVPSVGCTRSPESAQPVAVSSSSSSLETTSETTTTTTTKRYASLGYTPRSPEHASRLPPPVVPPLATAAEAPATKKRCVSLGYSRPSEPAGASSPPMQQPMLESKRMASLGYTPRSAVEPAASLNGASPTQAKQQQQQQQALIEPKVVVKKTSTTNSSKSTGSSKLAASPLQPPIDCAGPTGYDTSVSSATISVPTRPVVSGIRPPAVFTDVSGPRYKSPTPRSVPLSDAISSSPSNDVNNSRSDPPPTGIRLPSRVPRQAIAKPDRRSTHSVVLVCGRTVGAIRLVYPSVCQHHLRRREQSTR